MSFHPHFRQSRSQGRQRTAEKTGLRRGRGSCQDFAHFARPRHLKRKKGEKGYAKFVLNFHEKLEETFTEGASQQGRQKLGQLKLVLSFQKTGSNFHLGAGARQRKGERAQGGGGATSAVEEKSLVRSSCQ